LVTTLIEREKEMIEAALAQSQGRVSGSSGTARKLRIPRQTLDARSFVFLQPIAKRSKPPINSHGLSLEEGRRYDSEGLMGRGLYIGKHASEIYPSVLR